MSTAPSVVNEPADTIAALGAEIIACGDVKCPGVDDSHIDASLAALFGSFSMSQLIKAPTRDDNVLDVLGSANPTAAFGAWVTDAGHASEYRFITDDIVIRTPRPNAQYTAHDIKAVYPVS
jgi:hypothetical protein